MKCTTTLLHRVQIAVAIAALATASAHAAVSAAPPADHTVDPGTLVPPPPDFFNASCRTAGRQILCDLAFIDPVSPVEEPTGIICGSGPDAFELLDTWSRTVQGTRYYSAEGLLLRRHFNDRYDGTLTNSVTGATVSYQQRNIFLHDLAIPGDVASGNERATVHLRVAAAHGTVLMDVGRVVRSLVDDAVLFQSGKHPLDDYANGDPEALRPLCDALSV